MPTESKRFAAKPINEIQPTLNELYVYRARVVRVIDGDSVVADIDLGCSMWLRGERCRLLGIDTPEMHGTDKPEGIRAKQAVRHILDAEGYDVVIKTVKDKKGKFGRWLLVIWTAQSVDSLNKRLLDAGLAEEF